MSKTKAILAGLLAGFLAAVVMTTAMLLLAALGVATPLFIIGDRLSVFIPPGPFLSLMGKVGGYNHLKQLGVGSTIAGQLLVGAIGGALYAMLSRPAAERRRLSGDVIRESRITRTSTGILTVAIFVVLPIIVFALLLWPVLGTSYIGLPIQVGRLVTLVGFALCVFLFERTLVTGFRFLMVGTDHWGPKSFRDTSQRDVPTNEFTPAIGRRAFVLGTIGLAAAGGGVALARKL